MAKKEAKSAKIQKPFRDYLFPLSWPLVALAAAVLIAFPLLFALETQGNVQRMERLQTQGVRTEGVIDREYIRRFAGRNEYIIAGTFEDAAGNTVDFDLPLSSLGSAVVPSSARPELVYEPADSSNVAFYGAVLTWDEARFQQQRTGDMIATEVVALLMMVLGWLAYSFRRYWVARR